MCLISFSVQAQHFNTDQTRSDLQHLKEAIEAYNPALEAYNPNFTAQASDLIALIKRDSISLNQYFQYVSKLCALSNEGHFSLGDWSDTVHVGLTNNSYKYLPVSVKILSNRIFIWEDYSNEQELVKGAEIVSINGLNSANIISILDSFLPSDGTIKTYAHKKIGLGFAWMYYLYIKQAASFEIDVMLLSGETKSVSIEAVKIGKQRENYQEFVTSKSSPKETESDRFYELKHEQNISFLTLPSFDFKRIEKYDVEAKSMYNSIFEELETKNTKHLVVDLRGNTGGRYEFASEIIPFILKEGKDTPFLKKSVSWKGKEKTHKMPKPSKSVFEGNVYVLVDGLTFSSGGTLTRYLKEFANATIIGEETGSRYEGYAAGSQQYITLPNSKVVIKIPRYWTSYPASSKQNSTNRGVLPDHQITYTIKDLMDDKDLHMEKVRSLIQ